MDALKGAIVSFFSQKISLIALGRGASTVRYLKSAA
jgi:hypothetical protein